MREGSDACSDRSAASRGAVRKGSDAWRSSGSCRLRCGARSDGGSVTVDFRPLVPTIRSMEKVVSRVTAREATRT